MKYKLFGTTGLYASEMVLGAAMFGTGSDYGSNPEEARAIFEHYAEAGGNFIDTSDQYKLGESERLIGKFIAANRNDFVISSKYTRTSRSNPPSGAIGNNRKIMVQSVEESLKRLKTDHIDIYMAHFDDGVTPVEEIVRGLDDLAKAGKINYGGLANFSAWKTATASNTANIRGLVPMAALQIEYNLLQRTAERELLPMAKHFGMGLMTYSPLAGGILTGKYRKGETGRINLMGGLEKTKAAKTEAVMDVLISVADEIGANPGQVAIAWVNAKGGFTIIGPRTSAQLEDNLGAINIQLNQEHLNKLDEVSAISLDYPHEINNAQQQMIQDKQLN
ncbi:MAG: aldo/keto reductase [Mucilaginibacter sp.]|uniref:aldo/keto reductase n=1 Tax=Mucilaginibacter sp. TaxID=1882438 RepID=UPI0034E3AFD8